MPDSIVIIGSGGVGREIAATLKHPHFTNQYVLEGFIDDGPAAGTIINNLPILGNINWLIQQKQFKKVNLINMQKKSKNYWTMVFPSVKFLVCLSILTILHLILISTRET